jgi:anti-anti-sigma factor
MSVGLAPAAIAIEIDHDGATSTLRVRGALNVRQAAAARMAVRELLDACEPARRVIVDLGGVDELDAAGLAAVTSPVLQACRGGRAVSVLAPLAAGPRHLSDQVGILPIGPV